MEADLKELKERLRDDLEKTINEMVKDPAKFEESIFDRNKLRARRLVGRKGRKRER